VKTQCLCLQFISLYDIAVLRRLQYRFPQFGQNRLLQRNGAYFIFPQCSQPYNIYPYFISPQRIIFRTFSMTESRIVIPDIFTLSKCSLNILWIIFIPILYTITPEKESPHDWGLGADARRNALFLFYIIIIIFCQIGHTKK